MRPIAIPAAALLLLLPAVPSAAASITGVCPDGSIFIVQDRERIPCAAAKEVAPSEVPPMRPEYLPRPYSWQVYRERANPHNPYNLIDSARRVREMENGAPPSVAGAPPVGTTTLAPRGFGAAVAGAPPPQAAGPPEWGHAPAAEPVALDLAPEEVRDLFLIVELSQQTAPGRFVKEDARGEPVLEVAFAWSSAFEARVRDALPAAGPILVFTVLAHQDDAFHPNFTFVQGHESFRPNLDAPEQMGLLEGSAGPLAAEGVVLGYVVLPAQMDPGRPLDLYWNDRRIETTLRP